MTRPFIRIGNTASKKSNASSRPPSGALGELGAGVLHLAPEDFGTAVETASKTVRCAMISSSTDGIAIVPVPIPNPQIATRFAVRSGTLAPGRTAMTTILRLSIFKIMFLALATDVALRRSRLNGIASVATR